MFRQLNLILAFLSITLIISPLTQARGRDGHYRGKENGTKRHQIKIFKDKLHSKLTSEQRDTIKSKVSQLKAAETTHEEIKQTIDQMLQGFGIDPVQRKGKKRGQGQNPFDQLTEEKKSQVDTKVIEMREAGANRREIRKQIHSMLEGFGLEASQKKKGGKRGFRGKGKRRYTTPGQVKRQQLK